MLFARGVAGRAAARRSPPETARLWVCAPRPQPYRRLELTLARSLIQHLAGPFKANELHDTYRENVEQLIEQKRKGQKITAAPRTRKAPVIDLMEALKRSLDAAPVRASKSSVSGAKTPRKRRAA